MKQTLIIFAKKFQQPATMATTLALTLCCAGCISSSHIKPTILQTPTGNAVIVTLPKNTIIELPAAASEIPAAFPSDLVPVNAAKPNAFRLTTPLKLCSPSYILERDARELFYLRKINELQSLPAQTKPSIP